MVGECVRRRWIGEHRFSHRCRVDDVCRCDVLSVLGVCEREEATVCPCAGSGVCASACACVCVQVLNTRYEEGASIFYENCKSRKHSTSCFHLGILHSSGRVKGASPGVCDTF